MNPMRLIPNGSVLPWRIIARNVPSPLNSMSSVISATSSERRVRRSNPSDSSARLRNLYRLSGWTARHCSRCARVMPFACRGRYSFVRRSLRIAKLTSSSAVGLGKRNSWWILRIAYRHWRTEPGRRSTPCVAIKSHTASALTGNGLSPFTSQ